MRDYLWQGDAIAFPRPVRPADTEAHPIGQESSRSIWEVLVANGYLAGGGGATRKFDSGNPLFELALSQEFAALRPAVVDKIQSRLFRNRLVECDSEVERQFAKDLDDNDNVKLFVKLPRWFRIDTPIGLYNSDWAFVTEREERLYFVRETKSTLDSEARQTPLRDAGSGFRRGHQVFGGGDVSAIRNVSGANKTDLIKFSDKMSDSWAMRGFWRFLANNMRRIVTRV